MQGKACLPCQGDKPGRKEKWLALPEPDGRPSWARRIREERAARGWSQARLVTALRAHSDSELPGESSLLRRVKSWEAGEHVPDGFYRPLIAKTFGTVTDAIWPQPVQCESDVALLAATGMDTLEIVSRIRSSSIDSVTLDGLRITVDRLCCDYRHVPADQLVLEGRQWLRRITGLLDRRMTLSQHRELLTLAGLLAELVGCVEYDMSDHQSAECTRRAALSLGEEAGAPEVIGWAHAMQAWFALTQGDYRGVLRAAETGAAQAPGTRVAVLFAAQRARAWARIGDRRQVDAALDQGRALLERMPYSDSVDHHFAVDPGTWDFFAMDVYRVLGVSPPDGTENRLARAYAEDIIRLGTDYDGTEREPMRIAEALVTLGVVCARQGNFEEAVSHGRSAFHRKRQSLPTLLMVHSELAVAIQQFGDSDAAIEYRDELLTLQQQASIARLSVDP
jgi:tetratricopeptide (TPR) repeat protein